MGKKKKPDEDKRFKLTPNFKNPVRRALFGMMQGHLERFLYLDQLEQIYEASSALTSDDKDFLTAALEVLEIECDPQPEDLARIPKEGPLVVVANHPFGGVEGIILVNILRRVRPDVKIMANYLLGRMPEMNPYSIYVDPFGTDRSPKQNIRPIKESIEWLKEGHVLAVFPSGEVSHLDLSRRQVRDPVWSETVAGIIRRAKAPVAPIYFAGRNGNLFQLFGLLHPRFRTAMLPHEVLNKRQQRIEARIGRAIPFKRLEGFEDRTGLMGYLRFRTYLLSNRGTHPKEKKRRILKPFRPKDKPIIDAVDPERLQQEIVTLREKGGMLMETDDLAVFCGRADELPNILREIGRLREITFRAENEGTGQEIDLDRFDNHYLHLFVWSKVKQEIVGSYRIGMTDEILARHGKKGLYTSTLFRYKRKLLEQMGPSLEMGRSFIRPEYQRNYASLLLLWKGISQLLIRNPRYRNLFGPVSINNDYHSVSRQLLVAFLKINNFEPELAQLVKARNPLQFRPIREWDPETFVTSSPLDVGDLSEAISEIEKDQKGIPILLKQYLRLGGKLLSFNVDPDFSDVLDGLILVNLDEVDEQIVERFMGKEDGRAFLAYRNASSSQTSACSSTGISA